MHQALLPNFPINELLAFQVPGVDVSTAFNTRSAGSFAISSEPSVGDTLTIVVTSGLADAQATFTRLA